MNGTWCSHLVTVYYTNNNGLFTYQIKCSSARFTMTTTKGGNSNLDMLLHDKELSVNNEFSSVVYFIKRGNPII